MRTFARLLSVAALLLAAAIAPAFAQSTSPAPVQQSPTHLDACVFLQHSHTSAATLTIQPPASQYVYICEIDLSNASGASAVTVAAPTFLTTTGLPGLPQIIAASGVVAGVGQPAAVLQYPLGALKSTTPGGAVTLVLPAFPTNQTLSLNVAYYFAP
jgi:hypothetical protein